MTTTDRQRKIADRALRQVFQHLIFVNGMDVNSVNAIAFGLITKSLEDLHGKENARDFLLSAMDNVWGEPEIETPPDQAVIEAWHKINDTCGLHDQYEELLKPPLDILKNAILQIATNEENNGMVGYAMACCDIYRAGGEDYATEALLETGNGLQEFIDAGIDDERDIELITKIIPES